MTVQLFPSEFSYTVYEENLIFFSISVVDDNQYIHSEPSYEDDDKVNCDHDYVA